MAVRALLFDFDGLLVDTEVAGYEAWRAIYEEFGSPFDFGEWCEHVLTEGGHKDYAEHVDSFAGQQDWTSLHERRRAIRNRLCVPLPGVCELLTTATSMGLRLGIVSNSPSAWVQERMSTTEVGGIGFDVVVTADDGVVGKPAPDGYLAALAALSVSAGEAIVFEDAPRGVMAARAAGVYCVAIPNPVTSRGDFSQACEAFDAMSGVDLTALIARAEEAHLLGVI